MRWSYHFDLVIFSFCFYTFYVCIHASIQALTVNMAKRDFGEIGTTPYNPFLDIFSEFDMAQFVRCMNVLCIKIITTILIFDMMLVSTSSIFNLCFYDQVMLFAILLKVCQHIYTWILSVGTLICFHKK